MSILKLFIFSFIIISCCSGADEEILINDLNFNNISLPPYNDKQSFFLISNTKDTLKLTCSIEEKKHFSSNYRVCTKILYTKNIFNISVNGNIELSFYKNSEDNPAHLILENVPILNVDTKIEEDNIIIQEFFKTIKLNNKDYNNVYYCLLKYNINTKVYYTKDQGIICLERNYKQFYLN